MKSPFLEVRPEPINVGNVEDQPPPLGRGVAVFQIEDRVLSIFRAERGKIAIFVPVDELHAEQVPIEPDRGRHTATTRLTSEIFWTFTFTSRHHPLRHCGYIVAAHQKT